jgi:quinohemoprotein amine dehydrogenase
MWIAPDQSYAEGRWYWGEYQEMGFDVTLKRVSAAPTVLAVSNYGVKAGAKAAQLQIYGDNFPSTVAPGDLDLGAGVKVNKIVSHSPTEVVADIDVDAGAISGNRDVGVAGSILQNAFAVYHKVDHIAVKPDNALARLGGEVHPKGYQQFEAIAYENGPDGKPNTADDVKIGPVDVNWSVQQFLAVYGDDDKDFVGRLSDTGFFVPNAEGPNPKRKFSRNNYGNVWVVATAKTEKGKDGKPLQGRSYLVVAVPMYVMWDQPEVNNVQRPQVTQ